MNLMEIIPDIYVPSVYDINYLKLYSNGIRYGIFDVDCTILSFDNIEVTDRLIELFSKIKDFGITPGLCSSGSLKRVKPVADALGVNYIANAGKPFNGDFKLIKESLFDAECTPKNTMMVGDSFYLDMIFARRLGLYKVMVDPINDEKGDKAKSFANDFIQTSVYAFMPKGKIKKGNYYF